MLKYTLYIYIIQYVCIIQYIVHIILTFPSINKPHHVLTSGLGAGFRNKANWQSTVHLPYLNDHVLAALGQIDLMKWKNRVIVWPALCWLAAALTIDIDKGTDAVLVVAKTTELTHWQIGLSPTGQQPVDHWTNKTWYHWLHRHHTDNKCCAYYVRATRNNRF